MGMKGVLGGPWTESGAGPKRLQALSGRVGQGETDETAGRYRFGQTGLPARNGLPGLVVGCLRIPNFWPADCRCYSPAPGNCQKLWMMSYNRFKKV
jgi:hypothetical protein